MRVLVRAEGVCAKACMVKYFTWHMALYLE